MAMKKKDFEKAARNVECLCGTISMSDELFDDFNGHYLGEAAGVKADVYNSLSDNSYNGENGDYIGVVVGKDVVVEGALVDLLADGNGTGEVWVGVDKFGLGFVVVLENIKGYGVGYDQFRVITFAGSDMSE